MNKKKEGLLMLMNPAASLHWVHEPIHTSLWDLIITLFLTIILIIIFYRLR